MSNACYNLVMCTDYVTICFDHVVYTIAWVTTAIVSGLFGDYTRFTFLNLFIGTDNLKIYILTSLGI